ncbi:MAG: 1-deoxy-D-xylulose-5-phosphate synthase [Bacteroidales bacterium]|nr:1-deoxy-D-xylulose-5-phosphate synthase [Bacteroidales bacterium]
MEDNFKYTVLDKINSPGDVKNLDIDELKILCGELRQYIINVLSENPGHLASSLGTVELIVALHYLFNVPDDTLVFDVGHQAYAHKVLTERREQFKQIRKLNGLSGFPKRSESKYDNFGTGHASTSVSASLAMALADKIVGNDKNFHIAVIGDGSMTGGMAFEALNHAGSTSANLLVILNDNGISIDKRVGAMSQYFTNITSSAKYNKVKNQIWNALGGNKDEYNKHRTFFRSILLFFKNLFAGKSNFFEALHIRYFGPIDGHDLSTLISTIEKLKKIQGPKLLHIVTTKGKGLSVAENNPTVYHAPGVFDAKTGEREMKLADTNQPLKFSEVFGKSLVELAEKYGNIVAITPAMLSGSCLNEMNERFPQRTFDVGIAEEHAVTLAAGFATRNIRPFCCVYSSFLQRSFDQIIHDVALQNLAVTFCIDRAGLVGDDGATHHGVFDLAYLNMIPNMIVAAPKDEVEMRNMMYASLFVDRPFALRYPRGNGFITDWKQDFTAIEIGKAEEIYKGNRIAVLFIGTIGKECKDAIDEMANVDNEVGLYNFRFLKPLDEDTLKYIFETYKYIITAEDGVKTGGFGWSVRNFASENGYKNDITVLGIDDRFIEQGTIKQLKEICGIDKDSIKKKIYEKLV